MGTKWEKILRQLTYQTSLCCTEVFTTELTIQQPFQWGEIWYCDWFAGKATAYSAKQKIPNRGLKVCTSLELCFSAHALLENQSPWLFFKSGLKSSRNGRCIRRLNPSLEMTQANIQTSVSELKAWSQVCSWTRTDLKSCTLMHEWTTRFTYRSTEAPVMFVEVKMLERIEQWQISSLENSLCSLRPCRQCARWQENLDFRTWNDRFSIMGHKPGPGITHK